MKRKKKEHPENKIQTNICGVYIIFCLINGKFYIGSSNNVYHRWECKYNTHLTRAFKKHGKENFVFKIIEEVQEEKLLEREQYYLDWLEPWKRDVGYNKFCLVDRPTGIIVSNETKKKISDSKIGPKNAMFGKKRTQKWRDEHSIKMKEMFVGKKHWSFGKPSWNKGLPKEQQPRFGKPSTICGQNNPNVKITQQIADQIRELYSNKSQNGLTQKKLGEMFGITKSNVQMIIDNRTWKDPTYFYVKRGSNQ